MSGDMEVPPPPPPPGRAGIGYGVPGEGRPGEMVGGGAAGAGPQGIHQGVESSAAGYSGGYGGAGGSSTAATTAATTTQQQLDDKSKLYVGRLPPHTTAEMLLRLIQPHGRVLQIDVIPDRERQLVCRGFAFVQMEEETAARAAAAACNGTHFEGRTVEVRLKSEPRGSSGFRGGAGVGGGGGGGGGVTGGGSNPHGGGGSLFDEEARLYVAYMPAHYAQEDLRALLQPYGLVQECRIITDRETGRSRGFGFAQMMDPSQAQAAIAHPTASSYRERQTVGGSHRGPQGAGARGANKGAGWGP